LQVESKNLFYFCNTFIESTKINEMKIIYSLIVFAIFCIPALYSQPFTISGIISDSVTNAKLVGANVFINNTGESCVSDKDGFY